MYNNENKNENKIIIKKYEIRSIVSTLSKKILPKVDHKYSKNSDMYFPMLIITTMSVWEKKKNQIKKKKGIHAPKSTTYLCVTHGEIAYGVVLPKKSYL